MVGLLKREKNSNVKKHEHKIVIYRNKIKNGLTRASTGQKYVGAINNDGVSTTPVNRFPAAGYTNRKLTARSAHTNGQLIGGCRVNSNVMDCLRASRSAYPWRSSRLRFSVPAQASLLRHLRCSRLNSPRYLPQPEVIGKFG